MYECVTYYHKCWISRCKHAHSDETQRPRLISWHDNMRQRVAQGNSHHVQRYIQNRKLTLETATNDTIREWIRGVLNMEKVTSDYEHQDIRNWFNT